MSGQQAYKTCAHDDYAHHARDVVHRSFHSSQCRAPPREQVDQQHNYCDNQQEVD